MKVKIIIFITTVIFSFTISAQIRIILTAALADQHYELRKEQYIESFRLLSSYGYNNVYVVEALKKQGPTFLDDYSCNVFYSQANDPNILPGYNESRTLLDALYHFNFDPDDIIIKLTGRHHLISSNFIRYVEAHPELDAIFKSRDSQWLYTELFAMRCKHLIAMNEWVNKKNLIAISKKYDAPSIEYFYSSYLRSPKKYLPNIPNINIQYIVELGTRRQLLGSTSPRFKNTTPSAEDYTYL